MGGKKKRSRSRDRSEERSNSKRLRKLEDIMSGMLSSIASIQQAITTKELPESSEVDDHESVEDQLDEGEDGNREPAIQDEGKINDTPGSKVVNEPEVPGVLKDVTNKQPPVNSEKDVSVVTIDESVTQTKEAEAEVP
ncbi:uncharacterized protein LOC141531027 [Cotesia typhae]|uniref:uncharacterized protein LOC141531027 n=1 Tax=Cotesia typhae TaxID=2053667 RepID=UPI003D68117C